MVFKPIVERTPRHLIDDQDEQLGSPSLLPSIDISLEDQHLNDFLILPENLSFLVKSITSNAEEVGFIKIYNQKAKFIDPDDEFLQDEQLYPAHSRGSSKLSYQIPINNISALKLSYIIVPNLNPILYQLVSKQLLPRIQAARVSTITPGALPSNETINSVNSVDFHKLSPPSLITGISASLLSYSTLFNKPKVETIVLQSEGVPGYEKLDIEVISEISGYLAQRYQLPDEYTTKVLKAVQNTNSLNNHGLYI